MPKLWNDTDTTTLKRMWAEGRTAQSIADVLKRERNSVLGKAHRLELPRHILSTHSTRRKPVPKHITVAMKDKMKIRELEAGPMGEYTFEMIAGKPMCKYALGERGKVHTFCGKPCRGAWCDDHSRLVYRPAPGKKLFDEAV